MKDQPPHLESPDVLSNDPVDQVIRYHIRTKHHFHRYARSLGFLDWANQPDPFRRFTGASLFPLPLLNPDDEPRSPAYEALFRQGAVAAQPVTRRTLSRFLELALALSAWKKAGESEWALRSNPSSGNLHPTEGYLLLPASEGLDLSPGLYHYAPKEHGLERRASFSAADLLHLLDPFPAGSFLIGLTSVHWREAWKYGERAFRYCNHDIGHAIGSARMAAATLGWGMVLLDGADQNTAALLLGTSRADDFLDGEFEHPDCVAVIWPYQEPRAQSSSIPLFLEGDCVKRLNTGGTWFGTANRLSREHAVHWEVIDEVTEAAWKTTREEVVADTDGCPAGTGIVPEGGENGPDAGAIIRARRSAVSFDGRTGISAAALFQMLGRIMPQAAVPLLQRPVPWDSWPHRPAVHLLLFIHRVEGLLPGIYFLVRDSAKLSFVQQATNHELTWTPAPGSPADLPLYWLLEGDARKLAAQVSCHQDIAGDSAFSLGMVAEFEPRLREGGAWWYPRLFWESGLLGQVLYLEAEAAGVRATGIGCYFDDPVHEILSIKGLELQSLYHFTVGGPVEDPRLMTLPAYHHLHSRTG
jgi:SagB-type dehydrogenase family enzyme